MHRDRMSLSEGKVVVILPPREDFAPLSAGAISLVVQRFAAVTPGAVVMGSKRDVTFPGIAYVSVRRAAGVVAALRRLRPEVIEVHQQPRLAMFLALVFPARVLLVLHNDPLTMRGLRTRAGRLLALRVLHRVVCVSAYLRDRFMTGLARGSADVLPNPLTLEALPAPDGKRRKIVLFVGRITPDKAPDVFVAACAAALPGTAGLVGADDRRRSGSGRIVRRRRMWRGFVLRRRRRGWRSRGRARMRRCWKRWRRRRLWWCRAVGPSRSG